MITASEAEAGGELELPTAENTEPGAASAERLVDRSDAEIVDVKVFVTVVAGKSIPPLIVFVIV